MKIKEVKDSRKRYMQLLLLADEYESMIDRYLDRGNMYVLDDDGIKGECIVTDEGDGVCEIKSIAVDERYQRHGYGRALIDFVEKICRENYTILQVGTGDSPLTLPFYEKCGFRYSHRVKDFFIDNYPEPIYECGVQLYDISTKKAINICGKYQSSIFHRIHRNRIKLRLNILETTFGSMYGNVSGAMLQY